MVKKIQIISLGRRKQREQNIEFLLRIFEICSRSPKQSFISRVKVFIVGVNLCDREKVFQAFKVSADTINNNVREKADFSLKSI